jgi:hypothetical protein
MNPKRAKAVRMALDPINIAVERGDHPHLHDLADLLDSGFASKDSLHYIARYLRGELRGIRPEGRIPRHSERRDIAKRRIRLTMAEGVVAMLMNMQDDWRKRRLKIARTPLDDVIDTVAPLYGLTAHELRQWWRVERFNIR